VNLYVWPTAALMVAGGKAANNWMDSWWLESTLKGGRQSNHNGRRTMGSLQWSNLIENAAAPGYHVAMSKRSLECIRAKGPPARKWNIQIRVVQYCIIPELDHPVTNIALLSCPKVLHDIGWQDEGVSSCIDGPVRLQLRHYFSRGSWEWILLRQGRP
jgi:hypothetical protein